MAAALADEPSIPFRIPSGIRLIRVSAETGVVAAPGETNVILEAFKRGTAPRQPGRLIDGGYNPAIPGAVAAPAPSAVGGIY